MKINVKSKGFVLGFLTFYLLGSNTIWAKEGMKVPPSLLKDSLDIKKSGLSIPINTLYNNKGDGLNNAVVLFGSGCTAELISSKGLLLTNHHCGYGTVQGLASTSADYFANGFWAKDNKEEIPCPGLTVTIYRQLEDVTQRILNNIDDEMEEPQRDSIIKTRIKHLENGFKFIYKKDVKIKAYAYNNQYWALISDTYKDVRLVGFPPNGIGSFGGDTDNWSWPRHTGDFSIFRVYADSNNLPAAYSPNNKPYETTTFFTINTQGYKEGDFTLVYGFPYLTQEYISSMQLSQVVDIIDPIRIEARTKKLNVWNKAMAENRDVFIKYTSKRASVANGWKKWQGELKGLKTNNVVGLKKQEELDFEQWAHTNPDAPAYSKDLLFKMQAVASSNNTYLQAFEILRESFLGIELMAQGATLDKLLKIYNSTLSSNEIQDSVTKTIQQSKSFYKNFDLKTDQKLFETLMPLFMSKSGLFIPSYFNTELARNGNSYKKWAQYLYNNSYVNNFEKLQNIKKDEIANDPVWKMYNAVNETRNKQIQPQLKATNDSFERFNRLYMKALQLKNKYKKLYPDANGTLRIAYGQIKGIDPDGDAGYSYQTNLDEAILKHNPEITEFNAPSKLIELHKNKDYGRWAVNGTVPIAFVADNHTSGGNSGSPVLNANGELIGTNFDRIWEGTMSDYYFDEKWCRNISVDIRYTLFIIEKLGGAGWLLNELKFAPIKQ